jgi:hypothetical protein
VQKILFLLLFATSLVSAQQRILFDATKAQMAGNADWVIDADQHDLGIATGGLMTGGLGSESNPQQTATPAQLNINAATPETFWDGSLSSWAIDMVKQGYEVETLPYYQTITYGKSSNPQDLSRYKVFICDEPNIQFSASEKDALVQFVMHGGGLFMISDHDQSDRNFDGWDSPHIWNSLMDSNTVQANPFGMTFDYYNFSQLSTNIANQPGDRCLHGPMGDVTGINFSNGTSITLNQNQNATVKGLVYKNGTSTLGNNNALFATCFFGQGKVAALGDSSPPDDGTGDPNDGLYTAYAGEANGAHRKLLVNTTIWLATTNTDTTVNDVDDNHGSKLLEVYPNPVREQLFLKDDAKAVTSLSIFDSEGKLVYETQVKDGTSRPFIETKSWAPGMYVIKVCGAQYLKTGKFLKL